MKRFQITVPATSANLGPGFDTLGLALDLTASLDVEVDSSGDRVTLTDPPENIDPTDNLVVQAYREWGRREGVTLPGARLTLKSEIPVAKGLGSSAACILAGLAAAAAATGAKDARGRLLRYGTDMEGHPDNIAAAMMGGMTVAFRQQEEVRALPVANHLAMGIALFLPDDQLLTEQARALIPRRVPLDDAIYDLGRLGYLITALLWGRWDLIGPAMEDRLHQPYREEIIPALPAVIGTARETGAYGAALSGGGPAIIALCPRGEEEGIAEAMRTRAAECGWQGAPLLTHVRQSGLTVRKRTKKAVKGAAEAT